MRNPFKLWKSEKSNLAVESDGVGDHLDQVESSDLPIALYLNQRLTFDLLAALEGGFSSFATVVTASSGGTDSAVSGEGQFGLSNAFGLFNLKLGGQGSRQTRQQQSATTSENIVHTPASLFARFRKDLHDRELVRYVSPSSNLNEIRPGDFVEFEATLRKNPLVDLLSALSVLVSLMELAEPPTDQIGAETGRGNRRRGSKRIQPQGGMDDAKKQIEMFRSAVSAEGSEDLIAEIDEIRVVLTTQPGFFIDRSMNDTIDGTFRVFGKATRIILEDTDRISLLRKTALGKFGDPEANLGSAMEGLRNVGFTGPVDMEVRGPAMQVIPIAIFS